MGQTFPLPLPSTVPANVNFDKPRYNSNTDWRGGTVGNDVDVASANVSVGSAASGSLYPDFTPRHQTGKGAGMSPALPVLADLGKDYGAFAGLTGRTGPITPGLPYPDAASPPIITSVSPAGGAAAGGTAITITGAGFTGATGVTVGGTAATSVVVVDANMITAVTPAHAAGAVAVAVTTPKGTGSLAAAFTYA